MSLKWLKYTDRWSEVKGAARRTMGRVSDGQYPTNSWKKTILLCEHSPIRKILIGWLWDIKYWVSVHYVRHKFGIEHWVKSQRTDRTGIDRDRLRQDERVLHEVEANAQALIFISRRRLCNQASPETRAEWLAVKDEVHKVDPILASVMQPECIYRGFCPEFKPCGYCGTPAYQKALEEYRRKDV